MTKEIYALNTISGVVAKISPRVLNHPVLGVNYVEVENPDACIECGEQPDSVTTAEGEVIDLLDDLEIDDYEDEA